MVQTTTYIVDNTDGTLSIALQPRTYDGVGGVQRNTDITMYGNAAPGWGERFNENFLHLLENFACVDKTHPSVSGEPATETELGEGLGINKPIAGQVWFNKTNGRMYVFDGSSWTISSTRLSSGTVAPNYPETGDLWYDTSTNTLKVYDGSWIVTNISDNDSRYVNVSGDTMSGILNMGSYRISNVAAPTTGTDAANRTYVDNAISSLSSTIATNYYDNTEADNRFVNASGDTMSGALNLGGNRIENIGTPNSGDDAINWNYGDTRYLRLNGGSTMGGTLDMGGNPISDVSDPINPQDAATRAWVETLQQSIPQISYANPGYIRLRYPLTGSSQLVVQWGTTSVPAQGGTTVTLPVTYSAAYIVIAGIRTGGRPAGGNQDAHGATFLNNSQIRVWTAQDTGHSMDWITIGLVT